MNLPFSVWWAQARAGARALSLPYAALIYYDVYLLYAGSLAQLPIYIYFSIGECAPLSSFNRFCICFYFFFSIFFRSITFFLFCLPLFRVSAGIRWCVFFTPRTRDAYMLGVGIVNANITAARTISYSRVSNLKIVFALMWLTFDQEIE